MTELGRDKGTLSRLLLLSGGVVALGSLLGPSVLVDTVSFLLQGIFLLFFLRHLGFAISAMDSASNDIKAPICAPSTSDELPNVTVLVPCHNEELVVGSLAAALTELQYPAGRLQVILVNDGSADRTGELLEAVAADDPRLEVMHRSGGAGGGKSAALNVAAESATGEIIVVFDADHRPSPDILLRLVRHFRDPSVGAVQGRCEIVNSEMSLLSRLVAMDYMAGYLVNEFGRQGLFSLPAYGGANCAVRRSALEAVGGWNEQSVTEDTDLTMQLILNGWRLRYDVTAVDYEEGVVSLRRFWNQRYRWARGHQQVWRDYHSGIWRTTYLNPLEKLEATMFLLTFHVPVLCGFGLLASIGMLAGLLPPPPTVGLFIYWTLMFVGPLIELGTGLAVNQSPRMLVKNLIFFLPLFFVSMALCMKAWLDGLFNVKYSWVKTQRVGATVVGS